MKSPVLRLVPVLAIGVLAVAARADTLQRADAARTIHVSVVDSKGAPVEGLTAADFVVREDRVAREVLDARQAEAPIHVALLVDDSQAATEATARLREGLAAFLERLHGRAEFMLMTIGDRPTVLAPFTSDTAALQKQTARLFPRPGSGANLLDGIVEASRSLARRDAERRAIVVVTFEGVDYSNSQRDFVLDELRKSGAALHVIAVGSPSGSMSNEMRNRNMVIAEGTERTGGRRDQVLAVSGIPDKLAQAADELLHQYVVTYATPERLVPPERVNVSTTRPDLTARAPTRLAPPR